MKKTALPTAVAVNRAMNTLIEGEYWPATLSTEGAYIRRHDDTNGETGPEQELAVTFSPDGDAWVMLPGFTSLRFRTWAGGGCSLRVRKGLMVLAEAIRRDNAERPQHGLSAAPTATLPGVTAADAIAHAGAQAILRDVCELEYTDGGFDHEKMLSVTIDDLNLICKRQIAAMLETMKGGAQ